MPLDLKLIFRFCHQAGESEESAKATAGAAEQKATVKQEQQNPMANDPTEPIKTPPFASSPKLESTTAGPTTSPTFQQKRRLSAEALNEVSCVGADGTPLTGEGEEGPGKKYYWEELDEDQKRENDDYKEYFEERKASPLSEIEFADTRLPISRATDGEKRDDQWGGEGRGYYIRDTVDEALARAEAMFNAAREMGDPTMPHSRALRRKLRELYQSQMNERGTGQFT